MTQASTGRVSNSIRLLRVKHGDMTQQALADSVGVTRQTIVAIEQGRYSPSLEIAFRICGIFDAKMEDVFHYNPERRRGKK